MKQITGPERTVLVERLRASLGSGLTDKPDEIVSLIERLQNETAISFTAAERKHLAEFLTRHIKNTDSETELLRSFKAKLE